MRDPRLALCRLLLLLAASALVGTPAAADSIDEDDGTGEIFVGDLDGRRPGEVLEEPPRYGFYYDRYEPSFYTAFAPRALDPRRIHLHLGRGNQLRITLVLSNAVIESYARDLLHRYRTYRALIDAGRIELTQNLAVEEFEQTIRDLELERRIAEDAGLPPEELRRRNLELLERLNPGRLFEVRMPADEVVRRWLAELRPEDRRSMSRERKLELLNRMLPTRLWVAELDPGIAAELEALVSASPEPPASVDAAALARLRPAFFALFERVTNGFYPLRDGSLRFAEYTAVYPVGSFNDTTSYRGHRIPLYPTPGRRALTTHQRTKTVDHIPTKVSYSYFPWIPYMHVGDRLHNSVHTLWWKMEPAKTSFLPPSWQRVDAGSRNGEPFRYLWLLSRGPMSHGCTHLNAGHISELRQVLPSDTERLYEIDTFLNPSHLYDVFDIDGDFQPEVIGVRYFIAYSLRKQRPHRLRVRDERHAYYRWLYGDEIQYDAQDRGRFASVRDARFIGRKARAGAEYRGIPLYEAAYEPERIQFYRLVDIPFARELRKVSLQHPFPRLALP